MMAQMKLPGAAIEGPRCALPDAFVFFSTRVRWLLDSSFVCDENPHRALNFAVAELLAGAMGPRAIRLAAGWADGLCGFTWAAHADEIAPTFELARTTWREAGRGDPKLITGFWFALGAGAREQMSAHLGRYMNWLPAEERAAAQAGAGFTGSAGELRELLRQVEDLGADEVHLVPTCGDPDEVARAADAIG